MKLLGQKNNFLPPSRSSDWSNNQIHMRQISRKNANSGLIVYRPSVYIGEAQEQCVTHQNGGNQHLKYHCHLKTEKVLGWQLWEVTRKSTWTW